MTDTTLPFYVYGTLRSGFGNHRLFDSAVTDITPAHLHGAKMVAGGCPFVFLDGSDTTVLGEIVTIEPSRYPAVLKTVDRLEGYNGPGRFNLYERQIIEAVTETGQTVKAYAYLVDESDDFVQSNTAVPSGDYADYARSYAR